MLDFLLHDFLRLFVYMFFMTGWNLVLLWCFKGTFGKIRREMLMFLYVIELIVFFSG